MPNNDSANYTKYLAEKRRQAMDRLEAFGKNPDDLDRSELLSEMIKEHLNNTNPELARQSDILQYGDIKNSKQKLKDNIELRKNLFEDAKQVFKNDSPIKFDPTGHMSGGYINGFSPEEQPTLDVVPSIKDANGEYEASKKAVTLASDSPLSTPYHEYAHFLNDQVNRLYDPTGEYNEMVKNPEITDTFKKYNPQENVHQSLTSVTDKELPARLANINNNHITSGMYDLLPDNEEYKKDPGFSGFLFNRLKNELDKDEDDNGGQ